MTQCFRKEGWNQNLAYNLLEDLITTCRNVYFADQASSDYEAWKPCDYLTGFEVSHTYIYIYIYETCFACHIWFQYRNNIVNKARKLTGSLYQQFYRWSNPEALSKLYTTLIRPHLEYAALVWSPTLAEDIGLLENVQKFAFGICPTDWNSPPSKMWVVKTLCEKKLATWLSVIFIKLSMGLVLSLMFPLPHTPTITTHAHNQPLHLHNSLLIQN